MKLKELLENLKNKNNFKITFDGDDLGLEYWSYNKEDGYYHGIVNRIEIGRLSIADLKKAIVDTFSEIKLEIYK